MAEGASGMEGLESSCLGWLGQRGRIDHRDREDTRRQAADCTEGSGSEGYSDGC